MWIYMSHNRKNTSNALDRLIHWLRSPGRTYWPVDYGNASKAAAAAAAARTVKQATQQKPDGALTDVNTLLVCLTIYG